MISVPLARALRTAGLRWSPASGDRFVLLGGEAGDDDAVFTVSEMTIEAHTYPTGTILGFNGTTEWALDSVAIDDALWLPSEGQLRELLRSGFRSLGVQADGAFEVQIVFRGESMRFTAATADDAYGEALMHIVSAATLG